MLGKFTFDSDAAMYTGIAMLFAASLWTAWPQSMKSGQVCPDCLPPGVRPCALEVKYGFSDT